MKFGLGLLILAIFLKVASATENDNDLFTLPPSKVYIEACAKQALMLHPGVIEQARMQHQQGYFWVRYEIQSSDGSDWIVLCDMATGKIVREHKLVDDAAK